jgi:hypothetical protein
MKSIIPIIIAIMKTNESVRLIGLGVVDNVVVVGVVVVVSFVVWVMVGDVVVV